MKDLKKFLIFKLILLMYLAVGFTAIAFFYAPEYETISLSILLVIVYVMLMLYAFAEDEDDTKVDIVMRIILVGINYINKNILFFTVFNKPVKCFFNIYYFHYLYVMPKTVESGFSKIDLDKLNSKQMSIVHICTVGQV